MLRRVVQNIDECHDVEAPAFIGNMATVKCADGYFRFRPDHGVDAGNPDIRTQPGPERSDRAITASDVENACIVGKVRRGRCREDARPAIEYGCLMKRADERVDSAAHGLGIRV